MAESSENQIELEKIAGAKSTLVRLQEEIADLERRGQDPFYHPPASVSGDESVDANIEYLKDIQDPIDEVEKQMQEALQNIPESSRSQVVRELLNEGHTDAVLTLYNTLVGTLDEETMKAVDEAHEKRYPFTEE